MLLDSGQRLYLNGLGDVDETTENKGQNVLDVQYVVNIIMYLYYKLWYATGQWSATVP